MNMIKAIVKSSQWLLFIIISMQMNVYGQVGISQEMFSMDSTKVFQGDTVLIGLHFDPSDGVMFNSIQFDVLFDSESLSIDVIDENTLLKSHLIAINTNISGKISISAAGTDSIQTGGALLWFSIIGQTPSITNVLVSNIRVDESSSIEASISGEVFVFDRFCGDVSNDLTISTVDASNILRHTVGLTPQFPLVEQDSIAADVTGNGEITAFDATRILQYNVGLINELTCNGLLGKRIEFITNAEIQTLDVINSGIPNLQIDFSESLYDVHSIEIMIFLPNNISISKIHGIPDKWMYISNRIGNYIYLSMIGLQPIQEKKLEFEFEGYFVGQENVSNIYSSIKLNENRVVPLFLESSIDKPIATELYQNFPNPFNPSTTINYTIQEQSLVSVKVYDVLGQEVANLVNDIQEQGNYSVKWDASENASGLYIYRLIVNDQIFEKQMILIK